MKSGTAITHAANAASTGELACVVRGDRLVPRVVVSHPGRQHAQQVVLAAQQAGMLQRFVTSYYWGNHDPIARLSRRLSAKRTIEVRYLRRRWNPEIDRSFVTTFPSYHLVARLATPMIQAVTRGHAPDINHWADVLFDHWASDWLRSQPMPTIVHGFEGSALLVLRRARERGAKAVLDVPSAHEYLISERNRARKQHGLGRQRHPSLRVAEERRQADLLLAPSEYVAQCLIEHDVAANRIALVPYGVDVERFSPSKRPVNDCRFRVLFVGQVSVSKGIPDLLQAWKRLSIADAELLIAGGIDSDVRKFLHRAPTNVRCLGNLPFPTVHALYQSSDVFVLPSLAEGSALVTYEAMAVGLPVIVTRNTGSIARDGIDGYVIPIRDPDAIAESLDHLYHHPNLRVQMGAAGRQRIIEKYTWKHYRRRLAAAYAALASGQSVQDAVDRI
jgi:glycosyltransferase involved in cell wall biosynthesis